MELKLITTILSSTSGLEMIIIFGISAFVYYKIWKGKREDKNEQLTLNKDILESLRKISEITLMLSKGYSSNISEPQAKAIVTSVFHNSYKHFILDVQNIMDKNNIDATRDLIRENMLRNIESRFRRDRGLLSLYRVRGDLLSESMHLGWKGEIKDSILGYLLDRQGTTSQFRGGLKTSFESFEQTAHNWISNMVDTNTQKFKKIQDESI